MRAVRAPLIVLAFALAASRSAVAQQSAPAPADTTKKTAPNSELPLLPTRQTAFTTDEGTWLSLDVSPDGKTIVFDLVGDLYTLPMAGGKATRITSGMGFDGQPRFAPDGKSIVFVSDRSGYENLWLVNPDGRNPRAITKDKDAQWLSPAWTPDGRYLLASRTKTGILGSNYDLVLINKDGGTGLALTGPGAGAAGPPNPLLPPPYNNYLGASVSPDARYVYASVKRGGFKYDQMLTDRWQLGVYDRNTGQTYLRTTSLGGGMRPAISPDGQWIAYGSRLEDKTGLRLRNLASGDEVWLARDIQRDDSESRFTRDLLPGYAWTPDSKSVVLTYGGKLWRLAVPTGAATAIPFSADVQIDMGPLVKFEYPMDDSVLTVKQIRNARPSPDGKRLVFSALDKLWIKDLPNGPARRLTTNTGGEHSPAWSPDGRYIAYVTWTEQGGDVWRVATTANARPERLSRQTAFYDNLNYDPTGRRIVVIRGPREERIEKTDEFSGPGPQVKELVWLPAAGGEVTQIAPVNFYGRPHFTRDTMRVFIYDPVDGVVSMRWDGTDRRAHLKVTGFTDPLQGPTARPGPANEVILSPDGDQAFADVDNKLYLVAVPVTGGATPAISISNPSAAPVPVRRLSRVGGDFLGWTSDGRSLYWSLGHSYFTYGVAEASRAIADSSQRADSLTRAGAKPDTSAAAKKPAYAASRLDVVITTTKDRPTGVVALRGARIVSMKGNEVIERGDIVITNNRISAVGAAGTVTIPAGARAIDVTGTTIIPGWIDIHAHMWPSWGIHKTQVYEYLANLAYGVTTTRDPQTSSTDVLTYGDLVETGDMIGPRILSTGPGVFWTDEISSADDAREVLTRYSDFYQTHTLKQYMAGQRMIRQWILIGAKEQRITPTLEGGLDFKKNMTEAMDGYAGIEHTLPITPLYKDAVELFAKSGVTYTPTMLVQYGGPAAENYWYTHYDIHSDPKLARFTPHTELDRRALRRPSWFAEDQYAFKQFAAQTAKIVAAGGRVGLGGHGQLQGLGVHWELWSIASGGMPNHDVLRVGTIFGADAIGISRDVGTLEVGKLADLQVLEKNPLEDIRNTNTLRYVMKNGRLYDANTLKEVAPRDKALDKMWWVAQ